MRFILASASLLLACTTSAPGPGPVASPVPPVAKRAPVVRTPSCADAGVLLRGEVAHQDKDGTSKEELIAKVCATDAWSPTVVACIAKEADPEACLADLSEPQRTAYNAQVAQWHATYGAAAEGEGEEGGDDGMDDPPPPPEDEWITCEQAVQLTESWPPVIALTKDDQRKFAASVRAGALARVCDRDEWSTATKLCMKDATATTIGGCIQMLDTAQQKAVTLRLTELDTMVARSINVATKPSRIGCKQVVAEHYSDARWKDLPAEIKGAARKKAISESRTRMTKACTTEQWPSLERACMIAGGGDACSAVSGRAARWSFPAAGVIVKSGIAQCDAYGAVMSRVGTCEKLPAASRAALLESYTTSALYWLTTPADQRAVVGEACAAAAAALREAMTSLGCPL